MSTERVRTVGVFLFEDFEPLDVFGPVEVLGSLPDAFRVEFLGPAVAAVRCVTGQEVLASRTWDEGEPVDIMLVPGGPGTRTSVGDARLLAALRQHAAEAELVTSVCTGSAVLAAAGLLDGRRATSNKRAFEWVRSHGPRVEWVPEARWVVDGDRVTSGGVAAGMDMALALVARLCGEERAREVADRVEYDWHEDASWDPFAAKAGLV